MVLATVPSPRTTEGEVKGKNVIMKANEETCNRCGSNIIDNVCSNCVRLNSDYHICEKCGRYAMHHEKASVCVSCNDELRKGKGK